jgi:hypothetical protein
MTHDELLQAIEKTMFVPFGVKAAEALSAVVELHKPAFATVDGVKGPEWCYQCAEGRGYAKWPCPTIQAIEKELG